MAILAHPVALATTASIDQNAYPALAKRFPKSFVLCIVWELCS